MKTGFVVLAGITYGFLSHSAPSSPEREIPFVLTSPVTGRLPEKQVRWRVTEHLDPKAAGVLLEKQTETIRELVKDKRDPYTGKSNTPKACRELPKEIETENDFEKSRALHLFSSDTMVLGVCAEKTGFRTQHIMLYCKRSKSLYTISIFLDHGQSWPREILAKCRPERDS